MTRKLGSAHVHSGMSRIREYRMDQTFIIKAAESRVFGLKLLFVFDVLVTGVLIFLCHVAFKLPGLAKLTITAPLIGFGFVAWAFYMVYTAMKENREIVAKARAKEQSWKDEELTDWGILESKMTRMGKALTKILDVWDEYYGKRRVGMVDPIEDEEQLFDELVGLQKTFLGDVSALSKLYEQASENKEMTLDEGLAYLARVNPETVERVRALLIMTDEGWDKIDDWVMLATTGDTLSAKQIHATTQENGLLYLNLPETPSVQEDEEAPTR